MKRKNDNETGGGILGFAAKGADILDDEATSALKRALDADYSEIYGDVINEAIEIAGKKDTSD